MISEVDLRDWENRISTARYSLARIETDTGPDVSLDTLNDFINQVQKLVTIQQKQVAALFKPKE